MSTDLPIPETRVLAVASHVVYGYVGNSMAGLVMQSLGIEVAALNTVHFSNHTGYRQFKGTRATAEEIRDIYEGLKQSYLTDFDMMLSGYAPSADAVAAVGAIARDLKLQASTKPGSFFWVLDPVMGDQGRLYVNEDVVSAYTNLIRDADLILPNQFELETLSDTPITSLQDIKTAVTKLHSAHRIPHILVTSVHIPSSPGSSTSSPTLSVIGSSRRSDHTPRLFSISFSAIDCFFSGTGDMFAALTVARLREAVTSTPGLPTTNSWLSSDDVEATDLPLAQAAEKVVASMQAVLAKTKNERDKVLGGVGIGGEQGAMEKEAGNEKVGHLRRTKAAEVRVVRNLRELREPREVDRFRARRLEI